MSGTAGLIEQDEFDWLLEVQREIRYVPGAVLDMGSGSGTGSTRALVLGQKKYATGKIVWCVDPWPEPELEADFDKVTAKVRHRILKFKGTAREWWASEEGKLTLAFAFIDQANKSDAGFDLDRALERLSPGGIVSIHDNQMADIRAASDAHDLKNEAGHSIRWRRKD